MDIKNSNGLVGKYNDRDVYVATRKEYDDGATHHRNSYYILKDYPTIEGHLTLLRSNNIVGYCTNDGGIKIYNKEVPYVRANVEVSMKDRREYKYTIKDDDASHHPHKEFDLNKICASASEYIKDGLATGNKLLKEEQERAEKLCCATHDE